ncbi:hypothetical protein I6N90_22155 [Paenibacillus sp. GSMTC-2017]|uniref:hypothetical protein n=1 Tax=Paenibacillus sp. GSMTC-2017 TaxID=2794350 RepID=UPI0018D7D9EB|nr:hypothetical protein [Paenibacillus sp. GSMTC-2017]MBH5320500.1 hypothetical protein [Paenibacillus sp. GSMTC-2017]
MKQLSRFALIVMMITAVVISGCSGATPPKQALQAAILKTMDAESYKLSTTIQINELDLPVATEAKGFSIGSFAGILKDATIKVDAHYSKKSVRTDMNAEIVLPGMMDMKLTVPMIMQENLLYVKLPVLPLLQLPESVVGKYVVVDLDKLATDQGTNSPASFAELQKFIKEFSVAGLKHFDEKTYFSKVKAADAQLIEGLKVDQVVTFAINDKNYAGTVELLVNKVLPELLDIVLANEASHQVLQVEKAELEKLKADWDTDKTELLNVLQNDLKIHTLELTGAIKDKYLVYQNGKVNMEVTNKESGLINKVGFSFSGHYTELNKDVKFEQEIPKEVLTWEQVKVLLSSPVGL